MLPETDKPSAAWRVITPALLVAVFAHNVYRAAAQPLTTDEAYTYHLYLAQNLRRILTFYDANNHVLHTVLAKFSTLFFGTSEIAIRLPSLLGGLFYLITAYRLCRYLFGGRWLLLASFAGLALNPYVLDFLSAARGYGMSLGLFLYGLFCLIRWLERHDDRMLPRAGVAFGLGLAANLTLAMPVAALAAALAAMNRRRLSQLLDRFALPLVATAFILLIVPLMHRGAGSFYAGTEALQMTFLTLTTSSFRHHMTRLEQVQFAALAAGPWMVAGMLALAAVLTVRRDQTLRLVVSALCITVALLIAARYGAGLYYPELRTGLYFIPLFTVIWLLAVRTIQGERWRAAAASPLLAFILIYALQLNARTYTEWSFNAGNKRIMEVARNNRPFGRVGVRMAASWELVQSLEYYRERYRFKWLEAIDKTEVDGDFDFYVLLPRDQGIIEKRKLRVLYENKVAEVVLAAR
ncbi:MAG: glycosyltransferase family 39 protein [Acidobacteria bacterium]|nr:glycosyltransferase family 39 protein [Acidobacteriota bacterium]